MKKQKLTKTDKRYLANKAFNSVAQKANLYPAWMQDCFHNDLDAYDNAINRNAILN